tara:strand:+ start:215 stop:538 length:324 start_codon:yes stop_codon:yes gene_type:complete
MKKLITLFIFLLFTTFLFSQENTIKISPKSLNSWSSILIKAEKKGMYYLIIKDSKGKQILKKEVNISNKKIFAFKNNFKNYKKGNYSFQLIQNDSIISKIDIEKIKE